MGQCRAKILFAGLDQPISDLALQKRVPLPWEGHRLVFRMEGSNLLNHVELGLPGASFGSPTIGVISSLAGGPRTMQAAFRYEF